MAAAEEGAALVATFGTVTDVVEKREEHTRDRRANIFVVICPVAHLPSFLTLALCGLFRKLGVCRMRMWSYQLF